MKTTELLSISIASTLGYEKFVMDPIISLAKKVKVPAERLDDLMTIVGEAVANAIEHGNGKNADLDVQTIVSLSDNALILLIIDQGLKPIPEIPYTRNPNHPQGRGRGLEWIQSFADDVTSRALPGRNELEIVIKYPRALV